MKKPDQQESTYSFSSSVKNFASSGVDGIRKKPENPMINVDRPSYVQGKTYLIGNNAQSEKAYQDKNPLPSPPSSNTIHS